MMSRGFSFQVDKFRHPNLIQELLDAHGTLPAA